MDRCGKWVPETGPRSQGDLPMRTFLLALAVVLLLSVAGACRAEFDDAGGVGPINPKSNLAAGPLVTSNVASNRPANRVQLFIGTATEFKVVRFVVLCAGPASREPPRTIKNP